jgi:hypothetical protein
MGKLYFLKHNFVNKQKFTWLEKGESRYSEFWKYTLELVTSHM